MLIMMNKNFMEHDHNSSLLIGKLEKDDIIKERFVQVEIMKKVLFATGNESKAKRFKDGLLRNGIEIITINKPIKENI